MEQQEKNLDVKDFLKRAEDFYNKNNQLITTVATVVLVLVGGYFALVNLYLKPLEKEAQAQIFKAQSYFEMDSFDLALNGDGNYQGFLSIIDEYGWTSVEDIANYYAGICFLKKGNYEDAISHLKNFDADDLVVQSVALAAIGDSYMELGKDDDGISYYEKAVEASNNDFITPGLMKKTGLAFEKNGKFPQALKYYNKIKENYPKSTEGRDIEKYIARAEVRNSD